MKLKVAATKRVKMTPNHSFCYRPLHSRFVKIDDEVEGIAERIYRARIGNIANKPLA